MHTNPRHAPVSCGNKHSPGRTCHVSGDCTHSPCSNFAMAPVHLACLRVSVRLFVLQEICVKELFWWSVMWSISDFVLEPSLVQSFGVSNDADCKSANSTMSASKDCSFSATNFAYRDPWPPCVRRVASLARMYRFDCCYLCTLSPFCSSNYLTASNCSSPASDMVWSLCDGGDVDFDGVCLRAPSVLQLCREVFQSVDLSRDEFVMCRWAPSNCSCDFFSTAPERRCLRDFGPVASCIASWIFFFTAFLKTMKSMTVFSFGIPPISAGEENCCRFCTGVPMERVPGDGNSSPCCFEDSLPPKLFRDEPRQRSGPRSSPLVRSRSRRSQDLWSPSRTSWLRSRLRRLSRLLLAASA